MPLLFAGCSKLAVPDDYICSLVEQANSKMHSNWARVQRFFELLRQDAQQLSAAVPPTERQAKQQKGDQRPQVADPASSCITAACHTIVEVYTKSVTVTRVLGHNICAFMLLRRQCQAPWPRDTAESLAEAPACHPGAPGQA